MNAKKWYEWRLQLLESFSITGSIILRRQDSLDLIKHLGILLWNKRPCLGQSMYGRVLQSSDHHFCSIQITQLYTMLRNVN